MNVFHFWTLSMPKATWSLQEKKEIILKHSFSTLFCSVITSKFTADTSELSPNMQPKSTDYTQ